MTMLKRFCMAQNIRTLLKGLPPELEEISEIFDMAFDSDGRGTLQNEIGNYMDAQVLFANTEKTQNLKPPLYSLLKKDLYPRIPSISAFMQTHFDLRRVRYATFEHSPMDSYIIYADKSSGDWYAGRITDIMVQYHGGKFRMRLALETFPAVDDEEHDFYRAQDRGITLGSLHYSEVLPSKVIIRAKNIVCPFVARTLEVPGISKSCMHVIPQLRRCK